MDRRSGQTFSKEDIWKDANITNHQRQEIKITREHLTCFRMANIKKTTKTQIWAIMWGKGILVHCQWEYKLVQPQGKTVWSFLKRKKKKKKKILKQNYYMVQHDHSWVYIWNKQKH